MAKDPKEENKKQMSNRVVGYPSTRIKKLVIAISYTENKKPSQLVIKALRLLVGQIPEKEQEHLLKIYEGLTEEQRIRPYRVRESKKDY